MVGRVPGHMDLGGQHTGHRARGVGVGEPHEEGCESQIRSLPGQRMRQEAELSIENHLNINTLTYDAVTDQ